jgi:hypothetical protein
MTEKSHHSERRKYKRIKRPFIARLCIRPSDTAAKPAAYDIVSLRNLSAAGLLFTYSGELKEGTVLDFKIQVPALPLPIHCTGKVVRIEKTKPKPLYHVAVDFAEANDKELKAIDQVARELHKDAENSSQP